MRPGVLRAYEQLLDDLESGRVKLKKTPSVLTLLKNEQHRTQTEPAKSEAAKPELKPEAAKPVSPFEEDIALSLGLVRRNLRIPQAEVSKELGINERVLLLMEAGIAGMSSRETARILSYYAQRATETSGGQLLLEL